MKVYLNEPIPKVCGECTFHRKVYDSSHYICFLTGFPVSKIRTERPNNCPIVEE